MDQINDEVDSPAKATEEDIRQEIGSESSAQEDDAFVYFQSTTIISILIVVIISLVCILTTVVLIRSAMQSHGFTRTLTVYFGFQPNRTTDESIVTFWAPKHLVLNQPIETTTTTRTPSPSVRRPRPFSIRLSNAERKAQILFRNVFLPILFVLSILCAFLAFYMRRHHQYYPAWGARPKRPEHFITIEMKQPPRE